MEMPPDVTLRIRRALIAYRKLIQTRRQLERAEQGLQIVLGKLTQKETIVYEEIAGLRGPKYSRRPYDSTISESYRG